MHNSNFVHISPRLVISIVCCEDTPCPRFHEHLQFGVSNGRNILKHSTMSALVPTFRNTICALSNVKSSNLSGNGPSKPLMTSESWIGSDPSVPFKTCLVSGHENPLRYVKLKQLRVDFIHEARNHAFDSRRYLCNHLRVAGSEVQEVCKVGHAIIQRHPKQDWIDLLCEDSWASLSGGHWKRLLRC